MRRLLPLLLLCLAAPVCAGPGEWLRGGIPGLARADCYGTFRLLMENPYTSVELARAIFKSGRLEPLGTSHEADNDAFITRAKRRGLKNRIYLHVTMKVLKPLNDRLFISEAAEGKEDVNVTRDLFRALFVENLAALPQLQKALMARFMDFKTIEVEFDSNGYRGGKAQLRRDIDHVLSETNLQFEKAMLKIFGHESELVRKMMEEHGLVSDFTAWHLAGAAEGDPDLAAFAAREATARFDSGKSFGLKANHFADDSATERVEKIEEGLRPKLIAQLGGDSAVFAKDASGKHLVLSKDSIDLLRKVTVADLDEYVATVTAAFQERLKVKLTPAQVLMLQDYFAEADRFQPSIRVAKRVQIDLTKAKHGIVSVDFAGQNVENMYQTMGALAEAHARGGNIGQTAVELSRQGESLATDRLERLKANFRDAAEKAGLTGEVQFSGDDGILVLEKPLSPEEWSTLKRELAKFSDPMADYRMVTVSPVMKNLSEVDTGGLSRETVKAEDFEKKLRSKLYGYLPRERVAASGISVTLDTTSKRAVVTFPGTWTDLEIATVKRAIEEKKLTPAGYALTFPVVAY